MAAACLAAASATAEPLHDRAIDAYLDGGRRVELERLGPPTLDGRGRMTAPVEVRYADGRMARALVDDTAIVQVEVGREDALRAHGGRLIRPLMLSAGLWLAADDTGQDGAALAARLSSDVARASGVREAIPNLHLAMRTTADFTPSDPRFAGQWYFQNLNMPEAWGLSVGDASTTIVVVDTGCDLAHPDLVAKLDPGRDVVDGDDDPSFDPGADGAAHGTECAGLVGAATNNGEGIAGGCPECRVRCVRMLSDEAVPLSADVEAFEFALEVDAAVVSNSWGFVDDIPIPGVLATAIDNVATNGRGGKGALVLFAAGNDDSEIHDDELQAAPGVICVGAINNFDESTPFTNFGAALDLVAPTGTLTTDISGAGGDDPTDYTNLFGGTSSACPVAAGVAALLASAAPDKTAAELTAILISTTRPAPFAAPDDQGHDPLYGYGILDPPAALRSAMGLPAGEGGAGSGGAGEGGAGGAGAGDDDGEGCDCRASGAASSSGAFAIAGLAAAIAGYRRARRRLR